MFDANGTEGLELFTWVVGMLIALVGALILTHAHTVNKEEKGMEGTDEAEQHHTNTRI